ncbi:MAG TPA: AsmA family protein [Ramlibacter sp.]|nr:AsmA family protein [Ramlibacter sp.]
MKRFVKWLVAILLAGVLLLAAVAVVLQYWVRSEDFRGRVSQQISTAVGIPVQLGRVSVDVWPLPAVALDQVRFASRPPLTLERIEARPAWAELAQGRLQIATLVVRNAVVPEPAVSAIAAALKKPHPGVTTTRASGAVIGFLPRRTLLDHVTWVDAKGGSTTVDAQAQIDADGMPGTAQVQVLKGRFQGAKITLQRQPDHWALRTAIGGGSITGTLQLQPAPKGGGSLLQGQMDALNVEVAALTAPNRSLTGRLEAHTTWRAEFQELDALAEALHSQTRFTVHDAVVHGIDLAQAVKTVGLSRGGETRLDTLAGNVATQGRAVQLTNLVASSGLLSASGNVAIAPNRTLSGRITVDLASAAAGGALGVPLAVGGTLDAPSVMLTRGALAGAAIGTMLAPGVGTGAGAKLGDRIGEGLKGLFGK